MVTSVASASCAGPAAPVSPAAPSVPAPQRIRDATLVSNPDGDSVLVAATTVVRGRLGGRRSVYVPDRTFIYLRRRSLENGALLASTEVSRDGSFDLPGWSPWNCERALPGRVWCIDHYAKGLKVLDAASLQTIAQQSQILGGTPELAGEPPFGGMRVDPKTRGFVFESRDGYAWIVDPTTLVPARFSGSIRSVPERVGGAFPDTDWHTPVMGGYWYFFNRAETRATLERSPPDTNERTPLHPEHSYLRGRFLTSRSDELPGHRKVPIRSTTRRACSSSRRGSTTGPPCGASSRTAQLSGRRANCRTAFWTPRFTETRSCS